MKYKSEEVLVTVVVPVYNVEKYLDCCIESIVNQTYHNLEIILVDDGSRDSSGCICDHWANNDNRIKVIHQENGGLSSARNTGLESAKGQFISFIDSDDYIHNDFIQEMLQSCIKYNAKLCICGMESVADDFAPQYNDEINTELIDQGQLYNQLYSGRNVETVSAANKLYASELFNNLRYPVGKRHEDEAIIHFLIEKIEYAVWINCPLYYYRQTPNSITRQGYNLKMLDELWSKEVRLTFFKERNLDDLYQKALYSYCSRIIYHVKQLKKIDNPEYNRAAFNCMKKYVNAYTELLKKDLSIKKRIRLWCSYLIYLINLNE